MMTGSCILSQTLCPSLLPQFLHGSESVRFNRPSFETEQRIGNLRGTMKALVIGYLLPTFNVGRFPQF